MIEVTDTTTAGVLTIDPVSDPQWAQLLERRRSDIFHAPEWLRSLRDTYDLPIEARVLFDNADSPVAGIVYSPIVDVMDERVVSLPFSDFCDPLVDTVAQWAAVTDGLVARDRRFHTRCLHSEVPLADPLLTRVGRARWHAIDVDRPGDGIWSGIDASARRSIRKAGKEGVAVRVGEDIEDVRAFFDLHLSVRKQKYGLLAQPWRFFESLWDNLLSRDAGVILLAVKDTKLLGGVMFLEWNDTLYYKFNASDADHLGVRPNDLVIWEGIQHAIDRGLTRFDFGLSDWDQEGLVRFKRKYATDERTINFLEHMPSGGPSARESETRALLPRITDLLTCPEVPDAVTEQAGDVLYRYFT